MRQFGKRYQYQLSIWAKAPYTVREDPRRPGRWQVLHPRGKVLEDGLTEEAARRTAEEWNRISGKDV